MGYAKGWDSIELTLTENEEGTVYAHTDEATGGRTPGYSLILDKLVNFITTNNPVTDSDRHPEEGLGKFVNYQDFDAFGLIERPGKVTGPVTVPDENLKSVGFDAFDFDPNP